MQRINNEMLPLLYNAQRIVWLLELDGRNTWILWYTACLLIFGRMDQCTRNYTKIWRTPKQPNENRAL